MDWLGETQRKSKIIRTNERNLRFRISSMTDGIFMKEIK